MISDLMAAITILAKGYEVNIVINGIDIGVTSGKSESFKLFGQTHSMVPVLPEDMKNLVCIKKGQNTITVKFKCLYNASKDGLTIEIKAKEQFLKDEFVFILKESLDPGSENTIQRVFTLNDCNN
ncbi:MAG: hypothetical protein L3J69_14080 [Desulfobacula sp.]|nr:hypothetical protein [Desulfobacula sp.]